MAQPANHKADSNNTVLNIRFAVQQDPVAILPQARAEISQLAADGRVTPTHINSFVYTLTEAHKANAIDNDEVVQHMQTIMVPGVSANLPPRQQRATEQRLEKVRERLENPKPPAPVVEVAPAPEPYSVALTTEKLQQAPKEVGYADFMPILPNAYNHLASAMKKNNSDDVATATKVAADGLHAMLAAKDDLVRHPKVLQPNETRKNCDANCVDKMLNNYAALLTVRNAVHDQDLPDLLAGGYLSSPYPRQNGPKAG